MVSGTKRCQGCWICRLRRKKCDEIRPLCGGCVSLDLPCVYSETKPDWMGGASSQQRMADKVKSHIKQKSIGRQERRLGRSNAHSFVNTSAADYDGSPCATKSIACQIRQTEIALFASPTGFYGKDIDPTLVSPQRTTPTSTIRASTLPSEVASTSLRPRTLSVTGDDTGPVPSNPATFPSLVESSFMTMYLDFVFPFLFPHYRPSVIDCGRHWLHDFIKRNHAIYHASITLGAYFTLTTHSLHRGNANINCKNLTWEKLTEQAQATIGIVQNEVENIRRQGFGASLVQSTRAIEETIYLLIFRVLVGTSLDWDMHLNPTLVLFSDILSYPGKESPQANLNAVLPMMERPSWAALNFIDPVPNTADQSTLRFFTGVLLFMDVVSSTALGQSPRLHIYHDSLLDQTHTNHARIELGAIVGCPNWVLTVIGHIASLDAWKKEANHAGALSVTDLVRRSESISWALEEGLAHLGEIETDPTPRLDIASEVYYGSLGLCPSTHRPCVSVTKIWALAACIYLSIVVSGWQPASQIIRQSVSQALDLFRELSSTAQVRSLAWPLSVVGCLVTVEQEIEFREVIAVADELCMVGSIGEVLLTVEAVWKRREKLASETWDLTKCLTVLGKPLLLI